MDVKKKLKILADAAKYDASCASSGSKRPQKTGGIGNTEGMGICHSYTPDGRCISLLKILLTNHCTFDCTYCINRVSSSVQRAKFTVSEIVWLTIEFYKRNYIEGLFLSSGIYGTPDETMEEMIEVARRLRRDEEFGGYIHLKAVAGAAAHLVQKAGWFADRVSANIELPTQDDLNKLAPAKTHSAIETTMTSLKLNIDENKEDRRKKSKAPIYAPGGQSTQIIVGASPSSDKTIITKASSLYTQHNLRRVYYSAYSPIPASDPRLPAQAPPMVREHRLYQADWLLRFYGFEASELLPSEEDNLDLDKDPKLAWALRSRDIFPVDINRAPKWALLRVPGLGIRNVERILKARVHSKLRLADLTRLRVSMNRAKYFVKTADYNPDLRSLDSVGLEESVAPKSKAIQPTLFEWAASAQTGEL